MLKFKDKIEKIYAKVGGPYYALNLETLKTNHASFTNAFRDVYPNVEIGYSFKTNYTKDIVRTLTDQGAYAEIVSRFEFHLASTLEIPISKVIYNGPFKDELTMREVLHGGGIVHLDSLADISILKKIEFGDVEPGSLRLGIRCNVLAGRIDSRFGFDINSKEFHEALQFIENQPNFILDALHIHYADRDLKYFEQRTKVFFEFIADNFAKPPRIINLGSGFFSEMDQETLASMKSVSPARFSDYADILRRLLPIIDPLNKSNFTLFFEPGTPIVVNTMILIGRIYGIKQIGSRTIATTNLSIFDYNPRSFPKTNPILILNEGKKETSFDAMIAGNTCVEKDILYESYKGTIEENDLILVKNVGSYSNVMKPPFIFESLPIVIVDDEFNFVRMSKKKLDANIISNDYY